MTPSLPQRGRQHAGSIPLTPSFSEYFSTLSGVIAIGGCPNGGGGSMKSWSPQERLFVSMRISTEPFFNYPDLKEGKEKSLIREQLTSRIVLFP
jgi:hypothetical protein